MPVVLPVVVGEPIGILRHAAARVGGDVLRDRRCEPPGVVVADIESGEQLRLARETLHDLDVVGRVVRREQRIVREHVGPSSDVGPVETVERDHTVVGRRGKVAASIGERRRECCRPSNGIAVFCSFMRLRSSLRT